MKRSPQLTSVRPTTPLLRRLAAAVIAGYVIAGALLVAAIALEDWRVLAVAMAVSTASLVVDVRRLSMTYLARTTQIIALWQDEATADVVPLARRQEDGEPG